MPDIPHISAIDPAVCSFKTSIALTTENIVRTIPSANGTALAKSLKNDFMVLAFSSLNPQFPLRALRFSLVAPLLLLH